MKRTLYKGHGLRIEAETFRVRGKTVEITREIRPDVVVMVPRRKDGRFLIERQDRHAVKQYVYEFPAGHLEKGESAAAGARRELEEETGYRAKKIRHMLSVLWSPGRSTQVFRFYRAGGFERAKTGFDDTERITPLWVSEKRLDGMIRSGEIDDAKTILAYLYLKVYSKGR